ncbi:hypothetical protein D3C72_2069650 [compost metagenome]
MLLDVLEHIRLEVGPCRHIHDFEDGYQRKVVVERVGAGNQFSQPAEQLLKPQIGSETLVKGIFVKDHAGGFLGAQGVF